jgi:hypothetical protein
MGLLSDLRNRRSGSAPTPADPDSGEPASSAGGQAPVKGYDRLDAQQLYAKLHRYNQAELAEIEEYERANQNRIEVLQKLRYMRGSQPVEGYDDMPTEEIVTMLETADPATVKRVRDYERKFAGRRPIMEMIAGIQADRRAAGPSEPVPAYQAGGGSHPKA